MSTTTPDYSDKRILFTAFSVQPGSEALSGYEFVKSHGANNITTLYWGGEAVASKIPADITKIEVPGPDFDPELTRGYDLVFRHQTVRPEKILSPITTNTVEFFKHCPAQVIAVTGTKGKGTTTTLIYEILKAAGVRSRLLGNIGVPSLQELDDISSDEIVCFEISSFQLWDLRQSPHVAVVLMIAEDHQDVHSSIHEYVEAKANIARFQQSTDVCIHHPSNQYSLEVARSGPAQKVAFMTSDAAHIKEDAIYFGGTYIMPVSEVGLIGKHNLENVCAAISAAWLYTQDVQSIHRAVAAFRGLEHRLEEVAVVGGVAFFNDSFSAAPPAAAAAIQAFEEPVIAILGGYDRHMSFDEMAQQIQKSRLKHALIIGENQQTIAKAFDKVGIKNYTKSQARHMPDIVHQAFELAVEGDVVVLSPGSPSFDMFENYKKRGELYREAVRGLSS